MGSSALIVPAPPAVSQDKGNLEEGETKRAEVYTAVNDIVEQATTETDVVGGVSPQYLLILITKKLITPTPSRCNGRLEEKRGDKTTKRGI